MAVPLEEVVFQYGEQPSYDKWNTIGANHAKLNNGTALNTGIITPVKLNSSAGTTWDWVSFTPSMNNINIGTGGSANAQGYYCVIGKMVHFRIYIKLGTTSMSIGTPCRIAIPFGSISTLAIGLSTTTTTSRVIYAPLGLIEFEDDGASNYMGKVVYGSNYPDALQIIALKADDAFYSTQAIVSSSVPFSWGANDEMRMMGSYPIA